MYHRFSSMTISLAALTLAASGALAGCAGGSGTVEVGMSSEALTAAPSGSSSPAPATKHLAITVTQVEVHVADDHEDDADPATKGTKSDVAGAEDDGAGSGWVTVFSGSKRLDLLASDAERLLASTTVPAGKVTQIRLILADDAMLVDGSTSTPVSCPSCTKTGLKIVTAGSVTVAPGGKLHLTLDFDQEHSLSSDGSGYRLDPVIKLAKAKEE